MEATPALPLTWEARRARPGTGAPDPLLGTVVGNFRLVRVLGAGRVGTVYLAEQPVIRSQVAIKVLHQALAGDRDSIRRFLAEVRAVSELTHENLVRVLDVGLCPKDRPALVMELLRGETLESFLGRGAAAPEVAVLILEQLCAGLASAHDRGVVHREVRPGNVFLTRAGDGERLVKLGEFGTAGLSQRSGAGSSRAGAMPGAADYPAPEQPAGCPDAEALLDAAAYLAPEQCAGLPATPASDLYAVGVIAFRLFTGALPFPAPSVAQRFAAHLDRPPPELASLCPELPQQLAAATLRALAKDPADRFASLRELASALAAAARRPARTSSPRAPGPAPTLAQAAPDDALPPALQTPALQAPAPAAPDGALPVLALLPDGSSLSLGCTQLLVSGALLSGASSPPPLLSSLELRFPRAAPLPELTVPATVVRHVSAEEARAWGASPGFAVDFGGLQTATRVALRQLAASAPRRSPPDPGAASTGDEVTRALLARHEGAAGRNPYELLGLRSDAGAAAVRANGLRLLHELGAVRSPALSPELAARLATLLEHVRVAMRCLCHTATRLAIDARLGNFPGVARCLEEGLPLEELRRRRGELPRPGPAVTARVRRAMYEGMKAEAEGDLGAARALYEDALRLDPLHDELQCKYARLRRRL